MVNHVPPTIDFGAAHLDLAIEGYLCGLDVVEPDADRRIDADSPWAEELQDFVRHDDWMRRLAGSKRRDRAANR